MEILDSLLFMLNEMSPYILLGFLIAGLLHACVPRHTLAHHLAGTGVKPVVKAALLGVPLPLCSCGVLPTAIALRRAGASRAASTSFLIATPQTGVDSIAATWSLLGPAFAVVRPVAALVTSLLGGVAVGRDERSQLHPSIVPPEHSEASGHTHSHCAGCCEPAPSNRLVAALRYGFVDLVGSIGGWLVVGLVIAALITVFVPADFFASLGEMPVVAMLVVLVVAVPMYVCATGSIPIAMSLMLKGLSPGTALVLLMAGPAANFASFALISREMGRRAAVIYLGSIVAGSMAFGLAIDYLLPREWFEPAGAAAGCHAHSYSLFSTVCSAVLVALLIISFFKKRKHTHINTDTMTKTYIITGMNCSHCQATVTRAIAGVEGVKAVDVNLSDGRATVEGNPDDDDVRRAVRAAGFDVKD